MQWLQLQKHHTLLNHFMPLSLLIPPESIRKPEIFWCFLGVSKEIGGMKWVDRWRSKTGQCFERTFIEKSLTGSVKILPLWDWLPCSWELDYVGWQDQVPLLIEVACPLKPLVLLRLQKNNDTKLLTNANRNNMRDTACYMRDSLKTQLVICDSLQVVSW